MLHLRRQRKCRCASSSQMRSWVAVTAVTRVPQLAPQAMLRFERRVAGGGHDLPQARRDIGQGADRLPDKALARAASESVRALGGRLLQIGRVGQHDREQVGRCRCRVGRPRVAIRRQPWQQAAMVDMGVSEQDEGEFARVECQWPDIAFHGGKTLKHPAVREKTAAGGLQQKTRSGHLPSCAVEGQVDGHGVSSSGFVAALGLASAEGAEQQPSGRCLV